MSVTKGQIAKYTLLPGILPRLFAFFTSGFSRLAYYMALIYAMVRLLPNDHPYLIHQNIGRYGLRHVISEAANNLVFKRQNLDQIFIFGIILLGLVLMLLQFILLVIALLSSQPALAFGSVNFLFSNARPEQDIIFIIMDKVFGLVGFFNSCVSTGAVCLDGNGDPIAVAETVQYPYPFHQALHTMLAFYSQGILAVGALVLIYFAITIVGETATTGTPFGQRFNKAWAPLRVIAFFALLIPLSSATASGLNGAQLITFWVAKQGSNFATNAWNGFNRNLNETFLGAQGDLIAMPNIPEVGNLNQFMLTARTCKIAEEMTYRHLIKPYIVRPPPLSYESDIPHGPDSSPDALDFMTVEYDQALAFSSRGNIVIRFGALGLDTADDSDDPVSKYDEYSGNVFPYCGEIILFSDALAEPGSKFILEDYFLILQEMWSDADNIRVAACLANQHLVSGSTDPNCPDLANGRFTNAQNEYFQSHISAILLAGVEEQREQGEFGVPDELLEKGWGGAAIWFNKIAQMNGAVTSAVFNMPRANQYPFTLEETYQTRLKENAAVSGADRFSADFPPGVRFTIKGDRQNIHRPMYEAYNVWSSDNQQNSPQTSPSNNIVIDFFNTVLGTSGVFDMRRNADTHPLAQLTAIGRGMMEATIRNAAFATAGAVGEGILGIVSPFAKELGSAASNFLFSMVTASVGIAVILYYVLPLLPFIYFLFAISGWVKSIFEAIVAMPLWALSHLHIDGDGLPGQNAASGYFLLLEIFVRPILILFGLLASISIFAALISVLNDVFDLVVSNVGGFDAVLEGTLNGGTDTAASTFENAPTSIEFYRGPVDEFFFTALYAIIAYIIGLACFKMVDLVPNSILRWMGQSVSTFQENAGDPAGQLSQQVYKGSLLLANQVKGTAQGNLAIITA